MPKYQQGFYRPRFPEKYKGDPTKICFRSSWEKKLMIWCDTNSAVVSWQSEEVVIPYRSPIDGRIHRYFPDFTVQIKTQSGKIETWIVEVKPEAQTKEPKPQQRKTRKYINEVKTYAINKYKWDAAVEWCKDRNYKFIIMTEKHLAV